MSVENNEVHCNGCGRFLCKLFHGEIEIKCPNNKCKTVNRVKLTTYRQLLTTPPEPAILSA